MGQVSSSDQEFPDGSQCLYRSQVLATEKKVIVCSQQRNETRQRCRSKPLCGTCSLFSGTTIVSCKVGDGGRRACLKELRPLLMAGHCSFKCAFHTSGSGYSVEAGDG